MPQQSAVSSLAGERRPGVWPVVVVGSVAGLLVAGGIAGASGLSISAALGLPDPGALTALGLPIVRVVADIAAALTVGCLLLASVLVPPQANGYLDVAGYRSVRVAAACAGVWAGAALLMVPLTVSDAVGRPLQDVLAPAPLLAAVPLLSTSGAWLLTAVVALLVASGCRAVLSWGWSTVLLVVAIAGLLPVAASGHSAVGGSHDLATDSLMVHVAAAALWVGGLVAVLALAVSPASGRLTTALPRFSTIALWCWALMAVSGVVSLAVRVPLTADSLLAAYGSLAAAKIGALLILGMIGHAHRRRTLGPASRGERGPLLRLGGVEVILMLATIGLAVGLGRTPPPQAEPSPPSRTEEALGYPLTEVPGLGFLLEARLDLVFALLVAALLGGYVAGLRGARAGGVVWPWARTCAWIAGCVVVLVATSSGIGRYGAAMLSVGVVSQVLLSVVAPILLVAGAPLGLARAALPRQDPHGGPSPRGSLEWVLRRPTVAILRQPVPAVAVFVGGQAAMHLFGWLDLLLPTQTGRLAVDAFLLVAGCLLAAALTSGAPRAALRWGLAAVVATGSLGVGVLLLTRSTPIAEEYFRGLALPWVPDLLAEQETAGAAWLIGQLTLLPLLTVWLRSGRGRPERSVRSGSARRTPVRATAGGDR